MDTVRFRVSVAPLDGEAFIMEQFATESDARAFHASLVSEEDSIIAAVHYPCVTVTFEEFLKGHWVVTGRKLVVRR